MDKFSADSLKIGDFVHFTDVQRNAFLKHVVLAAGQSQRACAWPRDCRDKHLVPTYPLALQE